MSHEYETMYFETAIDWRRWLEVNHNSCAGIWFTYYKKHTHYRSVSYNESVEEALCFGWVDSLVKKIDSDSYVRKFTPRNPMSTWSKANKARIDKLLGQGKMAESGLRSIEVAKKNGKWDEVNSWDQPLEFSDEIFDLIKANPQAMSFYQGLSPSHQKYFKQWVMSAKREETRLRRANKMVNMLEQKKKWEM